jgi:nucleoside-diphosphate-sugar epimerase
MIAVTGSSGYVGGRILSHLRATIDPETVALVRRPDPADRRARRYALGEPLHESTLDGVETVVHAAHDLSCKGEAIRTVNCAGSLPLLDGLAARGGRVVLISSLSAFDGARSLYGQAKLALEQMVLERGGVVLRPGLVFGAGAGGLFGAMVAALSGGPSRRAVTPMVGGGRQRLFVTHDERLCSLVAAVLGRRPPAAGPVFAAHEAPSTLRAIAAQVARAHGRRLTAIGLPSSLVYLGLRSAEIAGLSLPFRSDSLLSLARPIPLDQVSALERSPIAFPPLTPRLWLPTPDVEPGRQPA